MTFLKRIAGVFFAVVPLAIHASPKNLEGCAKYITQMGSRVVPVAPEKPQTLPAPQTPTPSRPSRPAPRRAPNPLPDRKPAPTKDPKDLVPADLYRQDTSIPNFWAELPSEMKSQIVEFSTTERSRLMMKILGKAGTPKMREVIDEYKVLEEKIDAIESEHGEKIEALVQEMVTEFYGEEIAKSLELRLRGEFPPRDEPAAEYLPEKKSPSKAKSFVKHLKNFFTPLAGPTAREEKNKNLSEGYTNDMVLRRELYNLLAQAQGWIGMEIFVYYYGDKLNQISPGLAELFQRYHILKRAGIYLLIEIQLRAEFLRPTSVRDQLSEGREEVSIDWEEVIDPQDGAKYLDPKKITGIAAGKNAWALAHEATKAGFQMATALEASRRSVLTADERYELDKKTNSNLAEFRQGIFGPAVDRHFRDTLSTLINGAPQSRINNADFFRAIERVFILPPNIFKIFIETSYSKHFFLDASKQAYLKSLLFDHGVIAAAGDDVNDEP